MLITTKAFTGSKVEVVTARVELSGRPRIVAVWDLEGVEVDYLSEHGETTILEDALRGQG